MTKCYTGRVHAKSLKLHKLLLSEYTSIFFFTFREPIMDTMIKNVARGLFAVTPTKSKKIDGGIELPCISGYDEASKNVFLS